MRASSWAGAFVWAACGDPPTDGVTDTDTDALPSACATVAEPLQMDSLLLSEDVFGYGERSDGLQWVGESSLRTERGMYESNGYSPDVLVFPTDGVVRVVREDAAGNPYWLEGTGPEQVLWWRPGGGTPTPIIALSFGVYDFDLHPSGAVLSADPQELVWADPSTGTVERTPVSISDPYPWINAAVYALDYTHLWISTGVGVVTLAVDPDGRPTAGALPVAVPPPAGERDYMHLAVDACGRVYGILEAPVEGGAFVERFDETGAVVALPGTFDQLYPGQPLHFGRGPGETTRLGTSTMRYFEEQPYVVSWDVGVPARP